jgi:hypothetical protein
VHELALQVADHSYAHLQIDHRFRPTTQVDSHDRERLVHRHHEIAGAVDPFAIAERAEQRFTQDDADVLDGVVLIDIQIAGRAQRQVEAAVAREQFEHVVEEPDTRAHVVAAPAIDRQRSRDLRFRGATIEIGSPDGLAS